VNPMVDSVGGVGINTPERTTTGPKKRLAGADIEGKDIIHPFKPGEHCVVGKKRYMNVGSHSWLPDGWKEGLETIKGRKVSLVDRWILHKDYRRVGGRFTERLKQGKKNIPAPKAVRLNDGKKPRGRGRPLTQGRRHGLFIHYRDEPDDRRMQGKGSAPPGGEDHRNREWCQDAWRVQLGEVFWWSRGPPQGDPSRTGE